MDKVGGGISLIINNYNYGRFIIKAIESVLNQTINPYEIIVVDDGSTDNSLELIQPYKQAISIISKSNGGQASAFNAGFKASTGDWIWFIDADDLLVSTGLENVINILNEDIVKIQSPLLIINEEGDLTGGIYPTSKLSEGLVVNEVIENGDYSWPPTTGNVFKRSMLEKCMPIPEEDYRICADFYLCSFAGFNGYIASSPVPIGCYRVHSQNSFYGLTLDKTKIYRNGLVFLMVIDRTRKLVSDNTGNLKFEFPFNRRMLESLMIAKRIGKLSLPDDLTGIPMHKKWLHSKDFKDLHGKQKFKAIVYWLVLNYAPVFLTKYVVNFARQNN